MIVDDIGHSVLKTQNEFYKNIDAIKSTYEGQSDKKKNKKKKGKGKGDNLKIYASANFYKNPNVNSHKILKSQDKIIVIDTK